MDHIFSKLQRLRRNQWRADRVRVEYFPGFTTLQLCGKVTDLLSGDLTQFYAKACREYTLPRNDGSSQPKGWIQGNTKIGPVLEVTTSCLYGKHGVEIRVWSLSEDNTQSWVIISHGSNKFVIDSNNNDTEIPEDLPEEQALQLKVKVFAMPIKRQKQNRKEENLPALHQESFPWKEGIGLMLNQGNILSPNTRCRRK